MHDNDAIETLGFTHLAAIFVGSAVAGVCLAFAAAGLV